MIKIKRILACAIILSFFLSNMAYAEKDQLREEVLGDEIIEEIIEEEMEEVIEEKLEETEEIVEEEEDESLIEAEKAEEIPVLLYHHIASKEEIETFGWEKNESVVSIESFTEQIKFLKENDYYVASLEELELFMDEKIELPRKTVVISFDDGYLSNIEYAYPIMKENGFKGSIFMVGATSTRDESDLKPGELLHIPAEDIEKYEDVFEFACHSFDLHSKDERGNSLLVANSKEEIMEDLGKNQELFKSRYFAYPYGSYISDTINYIEELGYTMAFTVNPGFATRRTHKYEIPRITVLPNFAIEDFANRLMGEK